MEFAWIERYRWWLCVLSGLLLVLGFAPFAMPTCGWIALVPAWWVITRSPSARARPIRHGYLIGFLYFAGTFWWISDVTGIGTTLLVLYVAFYPGIWFLLIARIYRRWQGATPAKVLWQALGAAVFWVVLEWWRSWFLTGFDWDELGVTQSPSIVFRQLAAFGGVPLLSFALVFVNVLWAEGLLAMLETFRRHRVLRVSFPFGAALLLVALTFALGVHHLARHRGEKPGPAVHFACIQPDILPDLSASDDWQTSALDRMVKMSQEALRAKPDLLVWPEAILDQGVFQDRPLNAAVHTICETFDGYFLMGSQDFDFKHHKLYNCAYFFAPHGDMFDYYYKTRLVVWGEYLPLGNTFPRLRKWVGMGMDFSAGPTARKFTMEQPRVTFAPLICFEDTLAAVPQEANRLHPDFFITISNDAWYTGWFAQWGVRQHLNLARFLCVEHDRPLLRCTNNGLTCVIDEDGSVISQLTDAAGKSIDTAGIFTGTLRAYPAHATLYDRWGEWIVLLSSIAAVIITVSSLCRPALPRES